MPGVKSQKAKIDRKRSYISERDRLHYIENSNPRCNKFLSDPAGATFQVKLVGARGAAVFLLLPCLAQQACVTLGDCLIYRPLPPIPSLLEVFATLSLSPTLHRKHTLVTLIVHLDSFATSWDNPLPPPSARDKSCFTTRSIPSATMSFTPYDQEFDNFIDFDNGFHSPAEMRSPTSASATIDPMQSMYHSDASERRQVYSGPSHEYSRYRQLTGLPSGAMTAIPLDTEVKSEFPFSFQPSPSGPSMPYMDFSNTFDFDTPIDPLQSEPLPAYFFPNQTNTFMDTTPVAPQLSMSASAGPSQPQQQGRLWPGMHTQQAQQAQAEALARQQRQQQLGQQIMQQRNMQRQASAVSVASMPASRANSVVSVADSNVDDRISRLLDQMRNNNAMSTIDEEADDGPSEPSGRGKNKKDEEDMDEDERLLASEEGKKLSSKERRQLRNKVSARAFRSRRKGKNASFSASSTQANTYHRIHYSIGRRSSSENARV